MILCGLLIKRLARILQNKLLTYLWYMNLRCTLKGLGVIQKFNNIVATTNQDSQ